MPSHNPYLFFRLMQDVQPCILEMERNGFYCDLNKLKEIEITERALLATAEERLKIKVKEFGIEELNLRSAKQKSEFIYSLKLDKEKRIPWFKFITNLKIFNQDAQFKFEEAVDRYFVQLDTGLNLKPTFECGTQTGLSINYELLSSVRELNKDILVGSKKETFDLFYDIGRRSSFISRYIEGTLGALPNGLVEELPILHTSFNQFIAKTGILSSTNPNMQNWPRAAKFSIKQAITSRFKKGAIAKGDSSQIEIRALGAYYNSEFLKDDYRKGIDVHANAASIAFGPSFTDEQRNIVKSAIVFRSIYWGSAGAIVRDPSVPFTDVGEVQRIIDGLLNKYPEWRDGREADLSFVKKNGYLDVWMTGFRFYFQDLLDKSNGRLHYSLKNKVANYPIQHIAACLLYLAMIFCFIKFKELKLKSLLIGTVHDEIVCDVYPGEEKTVTSILKEALTTGTLELFKKYFGICFNFPLDCSVKILHSWGG